jgi:hypothetical protein
VNFTKFVRLVKSVKFHDSLQLVMNVSRVVKDLRVHQPSGELHEIRTSAQHHMKTSQWKLHVGLSKFVNSEEMIPGTIFAFLRLVTKFVTSYIDLYLAMDFTTCDNL